MQGPCTQDQNAQTFDHLIARTVNSLNVGRSSIFVCVKCRRIAAIANKNVQLFAACLFKVILYNIHFAN